MLTFPSTSQKQAGDVWIDYLHHTVWCGRLSTSVRRGASRLSTEEEVFNLLIKTRGRHKVTATNICQSEFREQETGRVVSGNLHGYRSEVSVISRLPLPPPSLPLPPPSLCVSVGCVSLVPAAPWHHLHVFHLSPTTSTFLLQSHWIPHIASGELCVLFCRINVSEAPLVLYTHI